MATGEAPWLVQTKDWRARTNAMAIGLLPGGRSDTTSPDPASALYCVCCSLEWQVAPTSPDRRQPTRDVNAIPAQMPGSFCAGWPPVPWLLVRSRAPEDVRCASDSGADIAERPRCAATDSRTAE